LSKKTNKNMIRLEEPGDMEATFNFKAQKIEHELIERIHQQNNNERTLQSKPPKTVWEKYLERRKEIRHERKIKAKAKRAAQIARQLPSESNKKVRGSDHNELELLADNVEEDRGFNFRGPQRSAHNSTAQHSKAKADQNFQFDVNDPRITKIFTSGDFDIDPTNPEFRRSQGMHDLLSKKRKQKAKAFYSFSDQAEPISARHVPNVESPDAMITKAKTNVPDKAFDRAKMNLDLRLFAARTTSCSKDKHVGNVIGKNKPVLAEFAAKNVRKARKTKRLKEMTKI